MWLALLLFPVRLHKQTNGRVAGASQKRHSHRSNEWRSRSWRETWSAWPYSTTTSTSTPPASCCRSWQRRSISERLCSTSCGRCSRVPPTYLGLILAATGKLCRAPTPVRKALAAATITKEQLAAPTSASVDGFMSELNNPTPRHVCHRQSAEVPHRIWTCRTPQVGCLPTLWHPNFIHLVMLIRSM